MIVMTESGSSPQSEHVASSAKRTRIMYMLVILLAVISLGLTVFAMRADASAGRAGRHPWAMPLGILVMGIGGLVGPRRPGLQRVLLAVSMILVAIGLVQVFRR